ncbi:GNAT family N-acetyltransferase [Rhabdothermincola sediminis]|uniref:GNAT family N-acetyltransferase n=1 Tax=Rhabdothermincola sediminis TaxID=2751370 RepID=UPI001AA04D0A|nr:GNAT family N-acetyltransferase [Rhabdothermincola sediminis]
MERWGPERLDELARLVDRALPQERLTADELLASSWDDPGIVLGTPSGDGAVSAVVRSFGELRIGWVKLIVVAPERQREGVGKALLHTAETWAFDQGASEVQLGGAAPFYLWPGVDVEMLGMLCLAESSGYESVGSEINMALPTEFRAEPPAGVALRRVLDDRDIEAVQTFVSAHWPWWRPELDRGVEQGGCHAAFTVSAHDVVGFACHSVNRSGWIGPMGTDPQRRHAGVGHALLGALCADLMVAHITRAEISWVGPVRFYAKAGARVSRSFRSYRKRR